MITHSGTMVLQTNRLVLRPFQLADAEDMLKYWISYPMAQARYMSDLCTTKEGAEQLLNNWIAAYADPTFYKWAVIERQSNRCIGQIALWGFDEPHSACDVYYCVGEAFQGKGYMTEAFRPVLGYAFTALHVELFRVCTRSSNVASQKVIRNCNFRHVKTDENALYENGVQVDRYFYELTKDEWLDGGVIA